MWFVLMVGANLEQRAGGNPLQNLDAKEFILPSGNVTYLSGLLGGNAQFLIDDINDTKIGASPSARNYLEHYATFTGKIRHPVIQLHSAYDTMAHVAGTGLYRDTVNDAGRGDLLLQAYTGLGTGHGIFTETQYLQTLAAMEEWLDAGTRPDPDDYFKVVDGFLPGFVPPPWPR